MCGIAGAIDLSGARTFPPERLGAMLGAIAHRGPDDDGVHAEPGLALGARRLAIIDIAGGRQPIANETGEIWVAFNGELYDYPELRRRLEERGHSQVTRCDTEAWVHLYEDGGEGVFHEARGQFAVALWDRRKQTLLLGRDRVGICPLYYATADGWLLWASEIKGLLASRLVRAEADIRGIDQFFSFFSPGTPRTAFAGISAVPPGHYLKVADGQVRLTRYWDLDFPDAGAERRVAKPEALADELEELMIRAVKRRLRSDAPIAAYLSGGVDSSYVVSLTGRERAARCTAFTVGFDEIGPDESGDARAAAKHLGAKMNPVIVDQGALVAAYPELTVAAEGPMLDTAAAAVLLMARRVHAQGYKVVLTGEGADEALAGYFWFKLQDTRERLNRAFGPGLARFLKKLPLRAAGPLTHQPPEYAARGTRPGQQDAYEFVAIAREGLYARSLWERLAGFDPYADMLLPNERITRWHPLNQSLYFGYKVMLAGLLLAGKGDRVAMASSVEARYPFLDEDVIQFCAGLAPEYKLRGSTEKWLLRVAASRVLPREVAWRPKRMFRAALSGTFLARNRPRWIDQLLSFDSLRKTHLFDADSVHYQRSQQERWPRVTPARFAYDIGLTNVIATQLWHHLYCGGGLCELPTWQPPPLTG